jgi:hypothetical protein
MRTVREKDLESLFAVAKAHGVSLNDVKALVVEVFDKKLNDIELDELINLSVWICEGLRPDPRMKRYIKTP